MSVHWKFQTIENCSHCGRITRGGCVCPESSSGRRAPPVRTAGKGQKDDFWAHDHFGLMDRFKE